MLRTNQGLEHGIGFYAILSNNQGMRYRVGFYAHSVPIKTWAIPLVYTLVSGPITDWGVA